MIASYASSQNNVTGVSNYSGPLAGKRLELLQEIAPGITRILAMVPVRESIAESSFQGLAETAQKLGIQVLRRDVTTREDIEHVFRDTPTGTVDALYHVPSSLMREHVALLIQQAHQEQIPLMVHETSMVDQGALAAYGANFAQAGAQAAKLVVKILHGTRPADIPIQTPDTLSLAINLRTARAIHLALPRSIVERADYIVE